MMSERIFILNNNTAKTPAASAQVLGNNLKVKNQTKSIEHSKSVRK